MGKGTAILAVAVSCVLVSFTLPRVAAAQAEALPRAVIASPPGVDGAGEREVEQQVRVSLAVATRRGTDMFNDGHFSDIPTFDAGVVADFVRVHRSGWLWGLGGRYAYGTGHQIYQNLRQSEHVWFVPVLFGWSGRFASGQALEIIGGVGLGGVSFTYGSNGNGYMEAYGPGAELTIDFIQPLTSRLALVAGVGARAIAVSGHNEMTSYYLENAGGFHGEIPLQLGLRIAL